MTAEIPDYIEHDGKKIPIDKDHYKKWALDAGKRILLFSKMKPIRTTLGDDLLSIVDMKEFVQIEDDKNGTIINIGEPGLKTKEGLIGLGGNYFTPFYLGADNAKEVIDSWNWVFEYMEIPKKDFEQSLEFSYVLDFISSGKAETKIFKIMSLVVDLKKLYDAGINIDKKITELSSKIKGNLRAFNKRKDNDAGPALFRIGLLTRELSDLSAEARLARFANAVGMDVKIQKSPDILIENVRVEVKFDRKDRMSDIGFSNKIKKGLKQKGSLVAIFTGTFERKKIRGMRITWLPNDSLLNALKQGISVCKNGKKCVLLFTGTNKGYFARLGLIR